MAGNITWQDPPARQQKHRTVELDELAEQLRTNPGRWAIVATNPYPGAADQYKRRGLEVTTRTRYEGDDVLYDVYARARA